MTDIHARFGEVDAAIDLLRKRAQRSQAVGVTTDVVYIVAALEGLADIVWQLAVSMASDRVDEAEARKALAERRAKTQASQ